MTFTVDTDTTASRGTHMYVHMRINMQTVIRIQVESLMYINCILICSFWPFELIKLLNYQCSDQIILK